MEVVKIEFVQTHKLVAPYTSTYKSTLQMLKIETALVDNEIGVKFENEVREIVGNAGARLQNVSETDINALSAVFANWWCLYQWYLPMASMQILDGYHYGKWYQYHANNASGTAGYKNLNAAVKVVRSALERVTGFFKGFANILEMIQTPRLIPGMETHMLFPVAGHLWDFDADQDLKELYDRADAIYDSAYLSTLTAIFGSGEMRIPMFLEPKMDIPFLHMLWAHSPIKYDDSGTKRCYFWKQTEALVATDYGSPPLPIFLTAFMLSPTVSGGSGAASTAADTFEWLECADNANLTDLVRMKTDYSALEDATDWTTDSTFGDHLARQWVGSHIAGATHCSLDWQQWQVLEPGVVEHNTKLLLRQATRGGSPSRNARKEYGGKKGGNKFQRGRRGGKRNQKGNPAARRGKKTRASDENEATSEQYGKGAD
jgi:hypothetical protein